MQPTAIHSFRDSHELAIILLSYPNLSLHIGACGYSNYSSAQLVETLIFSEVRVLPLFKILGPGALECKDPTQLALLLCNESFEGEWEQCELEYIINEASVKTF